MEMDAPASAPAPAVTPAETAAAPSTPGRLLNPDFLLLWSGQTVSQLGNQAYSLAMMFWLMEKTGSASLMGLVMMVSNLPSLVLSPLGGVFADRHSRIRIIVVCDLIAGGGLAVLTAAMWLMPERVQLLIVCLFVVSTILGLVRCFFLPAASASIPELVPKEKLVVANSMNQFSVHGALFVGQGIGGILYRLLGAPALFLIDAVSFFFSAGATSLIRLKERERELAPERTVKEVLRSYVRDLKEGFRYVWMNKGFRYFLIAASLINFFIMPVIVLVPFFVSLYLGKGSEWYGFLAASLGLGTICAYLLASALRLRGPARAWTVLIAMLAGPCLYGAVGFTRLPALALAGCFGFGLAIGLVNVHLMTIAQSSTPTELRGRVMGLVTALISGLVPFGMAVGGFVGDLTDKNIPLVYSACGTLAVITILATCLRRDTREYLAWGRQNPPGGAAA